MLKYLLKLFYSTGKDAPMYTDFAVLAVIIIIALTVYDVIWLHNHFNAVDFGGGVAGPLASHGAAAWGQGQQDKAAGQ